MVSLGHPDLGVRRQRGYRDERGTCRALDGLVSRGPGSMVHYLLLTCLGLFALDMSGVAFRWVTNRISR